MDMSDYTRKLLWGALGELIRRIESCPDSRERFAAAQFASLLRMATNDQIPNVNRTALEYVKNCVAERNKAAATQLAAADFLFNRRREFDLGQDPHREHSLAFFGTGGYTPPKEAWVIVIDEETGKYWFSRYVDGVINESYRPANQSDASIWAAAIIAGREPPKHLVGRDKPPARTPVEPHRGHEISV